MKTHALIKIAAVISLSFMLMTQAFAQTTIELNPTAKSANTAQNITKSGFTATFSFENIVTENIKTDRGIFSSLTIDGTYPCGHVGEPSLPAAHKLLAIPMGADNVSVTVKNYSTTTYRLSDYGISRIIPSQPMLRKDQKPEDIPFEYNEQAYNTKGMIELPIANYETLGTMRGIQVGSLSINPVAYDITNGIIKVYNDIEVEVNYNEYDENAAYEKFAKTFSPYFSGIYSQFFNEGIVKSIYDEHPDLWQSPVKMLVIANRMFESSIADWVAWKTQKGIYVDVHYTDEAAVGTSAASIKSFIQSKYAEDAPTFLMIMGDKDQVAASATGSATSCVTDLYYMSTDGDEFPEMFHSRFPAETVAQMDAMLEKALEYEQYTMPDPDYLSNTLLIAGYDTGWGITVGRPAIWYGTYYYYNTDHGFNNVYEYTTSTYTGCYDHLNTGVGFVNYTAHGSNTSWYNPSLTVSDVNNLTNTHKYFLAMGNCCQAADWGISGTCFGEAMVRAEDKAAYAYIGSCPSTYWLNDYYFAVGATSQADGTRPSYENSTMGCYDAIWRDDAYNTVCAIPFVGNLASNAAQANGYTLHVGTLYCWQAYHVLGDGSIMPFRVKPTDNSVSHLQTMPIGASTFTVEAAPGSYVGISKDGVLHGVGLIGESGSADIEITPITTSGDVTICVTHPQRIPYTSTIPAAAMNGPYISIDSYNLNNENEHLTYGETVNMTITLKNVGNETANNVDVALTSSSEYINITSGTATVTTIAAGDTHEISDYFTFTVADNIPDGTQVGFTLTSTSGDDTWTSNFSILADAPELQFVSMTVQEANIMPGQSGHLDIVVKNDGTAASSAGTLTLSSSTTLFAFTTTTFDIPALAADSTYVVTAAFTAGAAIPFGATIQVNCDLTAGQYSTSGTTQITVGIMTEDFETGDFSQYDWQFNAYPWTVTSSKAHGGSYSAKSTNTAHNSDGTMSITLDVTAEGNISFYYSVSSESNYDKLYFYIDGVQQGYWSGTIDWTLFSAAVTTGTHTFLWKYYKDYSVSTGSDCVWIDDIQFPPVYVEIPLAPVTNLEANVTGYQVSLNWTGNEEATQYIISRDGVQIATVEEETYFEALAESGDYTYTVVATDGIRLSDPTTIEVNIEHFTMQWTADPYLYADNMVITAVVELVGEEQYVNTLEVGAFCGTECRGSQVAQYFAPTGRYIYYLMVYGESGDVITFRIYDHVQDMELNMNCVTKPTFEPNAVLGNLGEPYIINFDNVVTHCTTLSAGNNWYSTYITIDGTQGLDLIKAGLGSSATIVKSQTSYTQYYEGYGWFGSLTTANNEQMYIINMTENHEVCLTGEAAIPSEHPIELHQLWNWIGYPVNGNLAVSTALNGITLSNNDIVKSQNSYSIYYEGYGWFGGLNTMTPGSGYMLFQAANLTQNLIYPSAGDDKALIANVTAQDNHYVPNVNKFATNMNITGAISIDGEIQRNENLEVAAFCNGEVRGSARPMYFEPLDKYVVMLTVYGNDGDNLTFKLFDTETGIEYATTAKESLTYSENAIVGTLTEPFVLNFNIANGISESEMSNVSIYPNPAQHGEEIMLSTTFDMVEVFNSIGIKVAEYQNVDRLKPINVAGSYIIRMTNGSAVTYGKVVVK